MLSPDSNTFIDKLSTIMFTRVASTLRHGCRRVNVSNPALRNHQRRNMGGGSHWMEVSETHKNLGEVFGFVCWMWIFYRARNDLPVVLGWRHPWEHAEDPWGHGGHHHHGDIDSGLDNIKELRSDWDSFQLKATVPGDGDDDDDDEDEDEEDDDE